MGDMPHAAKIVGSTTSQVKIAQECPKRRFRDDYVDRVRLPGPSFRVTIGTLLCREYHVIELPGPAKSPIFCAAGANSHAGLNFPKNCSSAAWPGIYVKLVAPPNLTT